jgi:hypothetical protein
MTDNMRSAVEERGHVLRVDLEVFAVGISTMAKSASVHQLEKELRRKWFLRMPRQVSTEDVSVHQHYARSAALFDHLDRLDHNLHLR